MGTSRKTRDAPGYSKWIAGGVFVVFVLLWMVSSSPRSHSTSAKDWAEDPGAFQRALAKRSRPCEEDDAWFCAPHQRAVFVSGERFVSEKSAAND